MAEKKLGKFFTYCFLTLFLFLVMMQVVFSFKGKLIRAEVLILMFLMFLSLMGFAGFRKSWGERILFFMFLIALGNMLFIWYFTCKLFMLPLFLILVGFLMSFPKKVERDVFEGECEGPYSEVFEEPPARGATEEPAAKKTPETTYSPGKYVASNMGSVYHEPKCQWAKRIAEDRRIWFKDKREAQSKKYKKHKCVE